LGITVALAFFVTSCTTVDDRLGSSLIPKNQRMEIEVTNTGNSVLTFLYREDSIPSSRTGSAWIGQTTDKDNLFGRQKSSVLLQFLPYTLPYSNADGYGKDPIVDSAMILLTLTGVRGDTIPEQRFDVWAVKDAFQPLHRDSVYYTNFPSGDYRGERLFHFTHKGRGNVAARLFPTAEGKAYLNSLVTMPWDEYISDSLFLKKNRGFIITPADDSNPAAALYGASLASSGLSLHVRNHDSLDVTAIYDTLTTFFTFRDTDQSASTTSSAVKWNNVSINMTSFDYSGSALGVLETATNGFTDTLPTGTVRERLFVQSMGGVGAYLRFTDGLIEEIRNLRFKTDEHGARIGKDIAINQAVMRIWLDMSTALDEIEALDKSMSRLGSYLNLKTLSPIPDYQYYTEMYRNQQLTAQGSSANYVLPYGGYLNRSNAYYELDITSYVQQLAKIKEDDSSYRYVSPAIFIAPDAYNIIGPGESVLKGVGSDQPVSIRITYTIIEG
jgi:hypothetical protein